MGCVCSRIFHCINRIDEPRQPKLRAIADDCQQHILPGILQYLVDVCLVLTAAIVDIHGQIKNPDKRGKITNLNDVDPFRRLDIKYHVLVEKLNQVTEELQKQRREIEECQRSTKRWSNACKAIFTLVTIGVIVGSVVLSALVTVPGAGAVTSGTAAEMLVKTVEQWISSVWEQQKDALEKEQKLVEKMQATVHASYGHLEDLLSLVQKVKSDYRGLAVDMEHASYGHLEGLLSLVQKVKSDYRGFAGDMEHFLHKFILKDVGASDDNKATVENKMKDMKINELIAWK